MSAVERTKRPYVTGSSVIGIKFKDGVMMVSDTLCSYGNMARYKNSSRLAEVAPKTILAAAGEYSDFQYLKKLCSDLETEDWMHCDGHRMGAGEISSYLGRVMYNRRSKFNPLWNQLIVGGVQHGQKILKYIDLQGTSFPEDFVATGFGMHLALPIIRKEWKADMTEAEARSLLENCMRILFYRDCVAYNKIQFAVARFDKEVEIGEPYEIDGKWDHSMWIKTSQQALAPGSDSW